MPKYVGGKGGFNLNIKRLLEILKYGRLAKTLYFTRKTKTEYISYSPEVEEDILDELIANTIRYLEPFINAEQTEFNPTGCVDGTIEICSLEYVGSFNDVIESFDGGNIEDIENEVENFSFYCIDIEIENENTNIKMFRRVTKFKRLYSSGILAAFQGNRLNKIQDKMLGIDGNVDLIVFDNQIAIFSHVSLERIFRLQEQFSVKANESIECLRNSNKIINFDAFEEDCLNDLRIQKILTRMLKDGNELNICFDNFDNIVETINVFELDIDIQRTPTEGVIYEDKKQVMDILRLARDSYYRSLIREKIGIDGIR